MGRAVEILCPTCLTCHLVPFHSGQVENLNLLVLGQVQNLYKGNKIVVVVFHILYFIFSYKFCISYFD